MGTDCPSPSSVSYTEDGEESREFGSPEEVVVREGRVKIRAVSGEKELYIDPLALALRALGGAPGAQGVQAEGQGCGLVSGTGRGYWSPARGLTDSSTASSLEYMQGRTARGTVAEVFPDGTFLVIPFDELEPWQSTVPEVASPTHFHVSPRALTAATSDLAQQYEKRILWPIFRPAALPSCRRGGTAVRECTPKQSPTRDTWGCLEEVGYRLDARL